MQSLVKRYNRIIICNKYRKINAIPKDMFIRLNKKYDIKSKIPQLTAVDSFEDDDINYNIFNIICTFEPPLNINQKNYIYNMVHHIVNNYDLTEEQTEYFINLLQYFGCS
jgi:hypothetical protein